MVSHAMESFLLILAIVFMSVCALTLMYPWNEHEGYKDTQLYLDPEKYRCQVYPRTAGMLGQNLFSGHTNYNSL